MEDFTAVAFDKAKYYCSYQERCVSEVRDKLYSFNLYKNEVEQLLILLIKENYLNEERFAIKYTLGKLKIKNWGKEKIKYALRQKQVSDYCIRKALALMSTTDYNKIFNSVANKKLAALKSEKNIFIKRKKIKDFLQQRGFEIRLINDYLKAL